jgi:hypothetical protein
LSDKNGLFLHWGHDFGLNLEFGLHFGFWSGSFLHLGLRFRFRPRFHLGLRLRLWDRLRLWFRFGFRFGLCLDDLRFLDYRGGDRFWLCRLWLRRFCNNLSLLLDRWRFNGILALFLAPEKKAHD